MSACNLRIIIRAKGGHVWMADCSSNDEAQAFKNKMKHELGIDLQLHEYQPALVPSLEVYTEKKRNENPIDPSVPHLITNMGGSVPGSQSNAG